MKRVISVSRVLAALKTAAVLLLVSGGAHAQLGALNNGLSPSNLGMPSNSPLAGSSNIPLGALQLSPGGLSPPPFAAVPGLPSTSPGVSAIGGLSSNAGLSPMPAPGFPALTPSGTAPGLAFPNITNFGAGGMQPLPGSPSTAR